jgi:DNA oxidative demethylase
MSAGHSHNRLRPPSGLFYQPGFVSTAEKKSILEYIASIHPIWEQRYSASNPPPEGDNQRWLLRPVYWLGNWQFACLGYYHPPRGLKERSVRAEPFPPVLRQLCDRIELLARRIFPKADVPAGWKLNTCLINYYGNKKIDGKWVDCARVGEHRDFEPGPVASLSFGERALFQFVHSTGRQSVPTLDFQQWLEDRSVQLFGGKTCKDALFHRVQRVDDKNKTRFEIGVPEFETRRINFTFRYVPESDWVDFKDLGNEKRADILPYVKELSIRSPFFKSLLH